MKNAKSAHGERPVVNRMAGAGRAQGSTPPLGTNKSERGSRPPNPGSQVRSPLPNVVSSTKQGAEASVERESAFSSRPTPVFPLFAVEWCASARGPRGEKAALFIQAPVERGHWRCVFQIGAALRVDLAKDARWLESDKVVAGLRFPSEQEADDFGAREIEAIPPRFRMHVRYVGAEFFPDYGDA